MAEIRRGKKKERQKERKKKKKKPQDKNIMVCHIPQGDHNYIIFFLSCFPLPILSGGRLNVYTHDVALMRT